MAQNVKLPSYSTPPYYPQSPTIWNLRVSEKSGITDSINLKFARIRIDSYNSLPIENILIFHNVIILIKLVVNKNKNNYQYNIFLEKGSYKHNSNTKYF